MQAQDEGPNEAGARGDGESCGSDTVPAMEVALFLCACDDARFPQDVTQFYHALNKLDHAELLRLQRQNNFGLIPFYEMVYKIMEEFVRKHGREATIGVIQQALEHTYLIDLKEKLENQFPEQPSRRLVVKAETDRKEEEVRRYVPIHYRLPTPLGAFQFRDTETGILFEVYKEFRQSSVATGIVVVRGEEGLGKASLVSNFCHLIRDIPFRGKAYSTIWLQCDSEPVLLRELKELFPVLGLDLPSTSPGTQNNFGFLQAVFRRLHEYHCEIPMLLVLENASARSTTLSWILSMLNSLPPPKAFVVVTSNSEEEEFYFSRCQMIRLGPFGIAQGETFVSDCSTHYNATPGPSAAPNLANVETADEEGVGNEDTRRLLRDEIVLTINSEPDTHVQNSITPFELGIAVHRRDFRVVSAEESVNQILNQLERQDSANGNNDLYLVVFLLCYLMPVKRISLQIMLDIGVMTLLKSEIEIKKAFIGLSRLGFCKLHNVVYQPNTYGLPDDFFVRYVECHGILRRALRCELLKNNTGKVNECLQMVIKNFQKLSPDSKEFLYDHQTIVVDTIADPKIKETVTILLTRGPMRPLHKRLNKGVRYLSVCLFLASIAVAKTARLVVQLPAPGLLSYLCFALAIAYVIVCPMFLWVTYRVAKSPLTFYGKYVIHHGAWFWKIGSTTVGVLSVSLVSFLTYLVREGETLLIVEGALVLIFFAIVGSIVRELQGFLRRNKMVSSS